ncbi:alpha/beta hydrolase [Paenibacillus lemnae]|uniref:Alpha/beta hydrolase n=1 Tax=Paenibacillus lemnae TaxID=1330551 RepID=A0A848MBD5_PAELE|nr:alpha/beta hydrolase [Paenibacillus lemnae]NMO97372.1 alpha/beta hydrolase [Paenibacillus lemnae]
MYIAAAIVLLMIILAAGITEYGYVQITQMRVKNDLKLFTVLESLGIYSRERYEALVKKEVVLTSSDGLKLSGAAIERDPESKRWMIIVHGYTASRAVSAQFIDMFTEEGCNVLLIDQRRHGQSEGRFTTYGYYEKYDVQCWVNWLVEQHGEDIEIGLHGQSLGGGTVLEYLSIAAPQVKLAIADCAYSDLSDLMKYQITKLNKLPSVPFFRWVNRRIQKKAGFSFEQVSPIRSVQNSPLPVMFIHGKEDRYVPTRMSIEMYEAKQGPKRLVLIDGAVHANAYHIGPHQYRKEVNSFLQEYWGERTVSEEAQEADYDAQPSVSKILMRDQSLGSV